MNDKIDALVSRADTEQESGQWAEAAETWLQVLEIEKDNLHAKIQRSNCQIKLTDYNSAETGFLEIIQSCPDKPAGYLGLATCYLRAEKISLALDYLYKAKHRFPDNINASLLLCQLFMRFKQYAIARSFLEDIVPASAGNIHVTRLRSQLDSDANHIYDQDGLLSVHNHDFMHNNAFSRAYDRGVIAAEGADYHWHWRVHIGLWAAKAATGIEGDFIECGVNKGFLSSAIMTNLDWNSLDRKYFLLDTFQGIDEKYVSKEEVDSGILVKNDKKLGQGSYTDSFEKVRQNFAEWNNVEIIQGSIPETLTRIDTDQVAFLHLDMNATIPEQAALNFFWERLAKGAIVLMDDYAYRGFIEQKKGMDAIAEHLGQDIASLPTGQGLLIKH